MSSQSFDNEPTIVAIDLLVGVVSPAYVVLLGINDIVIGITPPVRVAFHAKKGKSFARTPWSASVPIFFLQLPSPLT